jgi:hypothetical protein
MAILNTNSTQDSSLITQGKSFDFLTQAIKTKFLDSFETDIDSKPLYIFYGKSTPWLNSPNDLSDSPVKPNDSFSSDITTRENILAMKRVTKVDTRTAFVKFDWEYGKAFKQYDITKDQKSGSEREFYVFQGNNQAAGIKNYGAVYKCLDNNGGSGSTVRPDFNPQTKPVRLSDNYLWKYMFTIPAAEIAKFSTNQSPSDNYLPIIEDLTYKSDPGTIDRIDINSPGVDYNPPAASVFPLVDITGNSKLNDTPIGLFVEGDGLEINTSEIVIDSVVEAEGDTKGAITGFKANSLVPGGGYYRNASYGNWVPVRFEETGLTRGNLDNLKNINRKFSYGLAKINAFGSIDSPGDVKIIDSGTDYSAGSKVKIVQSSTIAYASVNNGALAKIKVMNPGKNHRTASVIPVHATGKGATFTAQISPYNGHGSVPKQELNTNAIFINNRVTSGATAVEEALGLQNIDFSKTNDFRQTGLIQAPLTYTDDPDSPAPLLTSDTATAKYSIIVPEIGDAIKDNISTDTLIQGNLSGARGRVVDVNIDTENSNFREIRYTKTGSADFREGENLLASGLTGIHKIRTGLNAVKKPEVDVFTGDILFINNSESISRDVDQSETVNFIITF